MYRPYCFYVYGRGGVLLFKHSWGDSRKTDADKLVFGVVNALQGQLIPKLSPEEYGEGFLGYQTEQYFLHHFRSLSGITFVLTTSLPLTKHRHSSSSASSTSSPSSLATATLAPVLSRIYSEIYVRWVSNNPLHKRSAASGTTTLITSAGFRKSVIDFIEEQLEGA